MNHADIAKLASIGHRLTPATFAQKVSMGSWIPAKHLLHIAIKIAINVRKGNTITVVSMPPRHGKSELLSVNTPSWHLNEWPHKEIMLTSYGADLSTDFSRKVRDIVNENESGVITAKLRQDTRQVNRFMTTKGGGLVAVGLQGALTGRGAHLMLVDDYIKNNEHALSPTARDKDYTWLMATAYPRREPGASMVIVATRWDVDDIIGRLLFEHRARVDYIRLPAIAEDDDPLGRKVGEALWPERYDIEELESIRDFMGTYWFEAEYQQAPMASMSGIVRGDMIKEVDILPHRTQLRIIRSWDHAGTEADGDYTVGIKYAKHITKREYYLLDIVRDRLGADGVEQLVKKTAIADANSHYPVEKIITEQEPGSAGKAVANNYNKRVLKDFASEFQTATGPLPARASALMAAIESGCLFALGGLKGLKEFKTEIDRFPIGDNDDQVAAAAQAHNELATGGGGLTWGETFMQGAPSGVIRPGNTGQIITGMTF